MKNPKLLRESVKYLLICMLATSCETSFDLMDLKLNTTNINDIINKDIEHENQNMGDKTYKIIRSEEILKINNLQLKNQVIDSTRLNHIWLEYDVKDSIIKGYELVFYIQKNDPKILFEKLKEKMGDPNFRHYPNYLDSYDNTDSNNFDAAIWEDKENKTFYMLEYNIWDETIRELRLNVLINNKLNLEDPTFSIRPFYFWRDYIIARDEMNSPNLTYQEFIKKEGRDYLHYTK